MTKAEPARTRILVVANRTAAAQRLLNAIEQRAAAEPCRFTLLVPDLAKGAEADWTIDTARRLLTQAARGPVDVLTGGPDPFVAVKTAVATGEFDEIIVSTLPKGISKWLRRDLIHRVRGLGLPVRAIYPGDGPRRGLDGIADDAMGMTGGAYRSASRGSGTDDGG